MQKTCTRNSPLKLRIQFWQLRYFFARIGQKNRSVSKIENKNQKKNCSLLKCCFGHVKCSSNIPVEKIDKKPKLSCSLSKIDENFHLFSKTVFSSKWFYRYDECSFDRPAKLFLLNYRKWSEKRSTKTAKTFQKYFLQKVPKETLKAAWKPRELFSDSQPKNFHSKFKKITICRLCKRLASESVHWNWESSFDNSATFFARIGQKNRSVSKNEKKIEIKLFYVKMLLWTRTMQFQYPRRKTRLEAENFLLNFWKWWKISFVFQKSFFSKWFYRYDECGFDRPGKIFLLNYRKWSEKRSTKTAKTFQKYFLQKVPKETLKAAWKPRERFSDSQPKDFYSKFKKITICRLCKRLASESVHWNWESSFDNSAIFLRELVKKIAQCPKLKIKIRNKTVLR